jgi:phosphoribosylamine--glycine ligase
MASAGYPASADPGRPIAGLERAAELVDVFVFHAGTGVDDHDRWVTAGGRVLGVTALGRDLAAARRRAYDAVAAIRFAGEHHRGDIAADALQHAAG